MDVCFQGHANAVFQSFIPDISIWLLGCPSRRLASRYASAAAALRGLSLRVLLRLCASAFASCSRLCFGLARGNGGESDTMTLGDSSRTRCGSYAHLLVVTTLHLCRMRVHALQFVVPFAASASRLPRLRRVGGVACGMHIAHINSYCDVQLHINPDERAITLFVFAQW